MLQRLTSAVGYRGARFASYLLASFLVLANAVDAGAAPSEASAAQALFDDAKVLMARGDYALACSKLEESQRLDPALGTLLNLADCREKQGKIATAWSLFRDAEGLSHRSGPPEAETVARERARALEDRVPRLVIAVEPGQPPGFRLTRDQIAVGSAQLGTPIPLDPGEYRLAASAPGHRPWQTTVSLREHAGTVSVTVPVLRPAAATPAVAGRRGAAAEPARDDSRDAPVPAASWVLGGVGIAALGTSVGLGLWAKSQYRGADCPGHVCRTEADLQQRDAARTKATAATAVFIGGALALGGGIVLWAMRPASSKQPGVSVSLGAGASSLVLAGEM